MHREGGRVGSDKIDNFRNERYVSFFIAKENLQHSLMPKTSFRKKERFSGGNAKKFLGGSCLCEKKLSFHVITY